MGMPNQPARVRCGKRSVSRGIGQSVRVGGDRFWEDEGEILVEASNEIVLRAEVGGELKPREGHVAEKAGAGGVHEALDARLAEEVDGLAGIADEEDSLGVAVPGFGEHFDEIVLAGGGVLHLVDQQMLEARAERGGEVVRAGFVAESVAGKETEFGEVALVMRGEHELKLDQGAAEHSEKSFGDDPLVFGVLGRGKAPHGEQYLK